MAQLEADLEAERADLDLAGAIVGVWLAGGESWIHALGSVGRDGTEPMRPTMYMRIGSVTKTFTGELILRLADEGLLSLDDPISRYLPDAPNGDAVTLRHLGRMESGYATYTFDPEFQRTLFEEPDTVWTPRAVIEIGWRNTLAGCPHEPSYCFEPGTAFAYNNTNLAMLGLVAEVVTGRPLAKLFHERLFEPLGMKSTFMPSDGSLPTPHSLGYTSQGLPVEERELQEASSWNPTWGFATGDLVSQLEDLATWAEVAGTGSGLSEAMGEERFRRSDLPPNQPERSYTFALGVRNGWWGHSGSTPGFTSTVQHHAERGATVVVMANGDQHFRRDPLDRATYSPADELAELLYATLARAWDEGG